MTQLFNIILLNINNSLKILNSEDINFKEIEIKEFNNETIFQTFINLFKYFLILINNLF